VQLTEVSMTGVRSAVITLSRPDSARRFVLFPMLHLGSDAFYRDVTASLRQCQVIVAEGIQRRSAVARALTLAYRLPGRSRRLGLVVQRIDYANLGVPVLTPDLTSTQLRHGWRSVPRLQRTVLLVAAPVLGAAFWLTGTRRMLSRYASAEDLPSLPESLTRERASELMELLIDRRDRLVAGALDRLCAEESDQPCDVAVVYGAAHMTGIIRHLHARHGYRPSNAEWLTVFEF
jgi:hypothetical protein